VVDKKLEGFSKADICALRLRCVEPYIAWASKNGVLKDEIFVCAEKSWEFMLKGLDEKNKEVTQD